MEPEDHVKAATAWTLGEAGSSTTPILLLLVVLVVLVRVLLLVLLLLRSPRRESAGSLILARSHGCECGCVLGHAGQIGRHTPDHSRALAEGDVLRHLLACMVHDNRYREAAGQVEGEGWLGGQEVGGRVGGWEGLHGA